MKANQRCFECKQWIAVGEAKCSCGWYVPRAEMIVPPNHDCQYQNSYRGCKLPGTMSHSTHGGGIWHCSFHHHSLGDPKKGEDLLDYIERHYEEIMGDRLDWRRKL